METSLIAHARAFAEDRHRGQTRKDRAARPYRVHLEEVAGLVARFGGADEVIAAAWLHDTVEDCPPTRLVEIEAAFGATVGSIVAEVTDDKSLDKAERKRRQVAGAAEKSPEAALVKVCDKISNARSVGATPLKNWPAARLGAYLDWAEEVVARLPAVPAAARLEFAAALAAARRAVAADR